MKTFLKHSLALITIAGLITACSDEKTPTQPQAMGPARAPQANILGKTSVDDSAAVFQAAGSTVDAIQNAVAAYRIALGEPNNGNQGSLTTGHREINWDGGSTTNQNTAISGNPSNVFKVTRGAVFTTPDGTGFIQAPPVADAVLFPPGGMAGEFNNPTYGTIFTTFSPSRLFSAIGSNITDVTFVVPGAGNGQPATVSGFGSVFTDVDQPHGSLTGQINGDGPSSTLIEYFGVDNKLLFSSSVPASQGRGSLSFFGVVFPDARIARVRITSGNVAPGPEDRGIVDVVMMDDFLYGEPRPLP
jgi:hypothetical protein